MTSREARTRRRAEERRTAKLAAKVEKSAAAQFPAPPSVETIPPLPRFNPRLEDKFPRELQLEANAMRDRIRRKAGLNPHGFVSHSEPKAPVGSRANATGFVSQQAVQPSPLEPTPADPADQTGFVWQNAPEPSKRAEINRANAQHSTGPKSSQGKLASSGNSLKHGLASGTIVIPGEDPAAFNALLRDLLDEHQPATHTEELLVNQMAQSYWLTQRALRFQNECFTENGVDEKRLSLFLRYQTTHDRAFHKALAALLKLQSQKRQRPIAACGFVSQSTVQPQNSGFVPRDDPKHPLTLTNNEEFVRQKTFHTQAEAA